MNAITRPQDRITLDIESLGWIALVVAAVVLLVAGSVLVRSANDEQQRQAAEATAVAQR